MRLLTLALSALLMCSVSASSNPTKLIVKEDSDTLFDPNKGEAGMFYTVPETAFQIKELYTGFLVGFYHDPRALPSLECLDESVEGDLEYVLDMIYGYHNILHFLDAVKFTSKSANVISNTFEQCGYKKMINDVREFCEEDPKRCMAPAVMTNLWWRSAVIAA